MSKRNVAWLSVTLGVGVLVWITAGFVWGLLAAVATLIASEIFERARRKKRRAARGETGSPSLADALKARRKHR